MGYCKVQINSSFFISADCVPKVIQAIKSIPKNSSKHSEGAYTWVSEYSNLDNIVELFKAWRYNISLDGKGNITNISFIGENQGDCIFLFEAIAPFVFPGSFIEWRGEDNTMWRDAFTCGKHQILHPTIIWG